VYPAVIVEGKSLVVDLSVDHDLTKRSAKSAISLKFNNF